MLTRVKKSWEISENQVTPEEIYFNRRTLLKMAGFATAGLVTSGFIPEAWAKDELKKLNFKKKCFLQS